MSDKKELIRQCFGADTDISWRPWGGYYIRTVSGGTMAMTSKDEFVDMRGGPDLYEGAVRLAAALGYGNVTITGDAQSVMAAAVTGQQIGIQVYAKARERFFGNDPAPAIPQVSGAHGTAGISSDEMLLRSGITGGRWGKGLRFAEDWSHNICRYDQDRCIVIVGPPRVGKTVTLLTSSVTENENSSLIVFDPKFEHLPMTERRRKSLGPQIVIAPCNEGAPPDCEHYFEESESYEPVERFINPKSDSRVSNAEALALLIAPPDNSGESTNAGFFSGSVHATIEGVTLYLREARPEEATLPKIGSILCNLAELCILSAAAMRDGSPEVQDRLSIFANPKAVMGEGSIGSIHQTIVQKCRWLSNPIAARLFRKPKTPWRWDDLKRRRTTVNICIPPKFAEATRPMMRVLLGTAFMELQETPAGAWPITAIVDEWPLLGKVELFSTIFAEGGSHGIRVVGIAQNTGQIRQTYGEAGLQHFLGCSGLKIFFPPQHMEDAEIISRMAGRKTVLTMSHSGNSGDNRRGDQSGFSVGETGADVLTPQQAMGLGPDRLICFAPGLVSDVMILRRRPFWDYRDIKPHVDDNPNAPGYKPRRSPRPLPKSQSRTQAQELEAKIRRWKEGLERTATP